MNNQIFPKRVNDISPAAGAFSQVTGVLGGFAVTIVVLALSPGTFPNNNNGKDWIVAVVLFGAAIYIMSSGILANAMSFADEQLRNVVFNGGIFLFHLGNLALCIGILLITYQFALHIARIVAWVISLLAAWFAIINFLPILFGVAQARK